MFGFHSTMSGSSTPADQHVFSISCGQGISGRSEVLRGGRVQLADSVRNCTIGNKLAGQWMVSGSVKDWVVMFIVQRDT